MSTPSTKRKRGDGADPDEDDGRDNDSGDSVIGLDVGGQLFYTHKSTLTAGSAYFAARFGGTFSAGSTRKDEHGQNIYFVDADAKLFEHILAYLRRGIPSWPKDDRVLVERLVGEAEYFGVEDMYDKLLGRATIVPNEAGKGILYWLGTRKGVDDYDNPYKRGDIRVELISVLEPEDDVADFFEYRPSCRGNGLISNECTLLLCGIYYEGPRHFSFVDTRVKPTHYSLRYGTCHGMSDWNFEASVDGVSWDILHEARKDRHLLKPSKEEYKQIVDADDDELVSIAEECHRHTWEVDASSYYKHFRFVILTRGQRESLYGRNVDGPGVLGPDGRILFSECLHGVGLELYGDVESST